MIPIETIVCPCCTPMILHALAQCGSDNLSRQMAWLGSGGLAMMVNQLKIQDATVTTAKSYIQRGLSQR